MNHHGSIDTMHGQEEKSTSSANENKMKSQENLDKDTKDSTIDDKNENNNLIDDKDEKKSKKDNSNTSNGLTTASFKTKYFPWIVCATSFVVQFFGLGFYKAFGPVYRESATGRAGRIRWKPGYHL